MSEPKPWKPIQISRDPPDGSSLTKGCQILRDPAQDAIAQRIGRVVSCWANAEWCLVEMYSYLMNLEEWAAADYFEEIRTAQSRFSVIYKTLAKKISPEFAKQAWDNVLEPVRDMYEERNTLAHGRLSLSSEYPDGVILSDGWGQIEQRKVYKISTLDALLTEMYDRTQKLEVLFIQITYLTPIRYDKGRLIPAGHPQMALESSKVHEEAASLLSTSSESRPPPKRA